MVLKLIQCQVVSNDLIESFDLKLCISCEYLARQNSCSKNSLHLLARCNRKNLQDLSRPDHILVFTFTLGPGISQLYIIYQITYVICELIDQLVQSKDDASGE